MGSTEVVFYRILCRLTWWQISFLLCIFNSSDVTMCIKDIMWLRHLHLQLHYNFHVESTHLVCLPLCAHRQCWKIVRTRRLDCPHNQNSTPARVRWLEIRSSAGAWVGRKEGNLSRSEILTKWVGTLVAFVFTQRPCFWVIKPS